MNEAMAWKQAILRSQRTGYSHAVIRVPTGIVNGNHRVVLAEGCSESAMDRVAAACGGKFIKRTIVIR